MALQKTHDLIHNKKHALNIVVVAENIRTPENLGMILRISEAFAVNEIIFTGTHGAHFSTKAKRASRNAHTLKNYKFTADSEEVIDDLTKKGYCCLALEITDTSTPVEDFDWGANAKLALFVGSERNGLSEIVLNRMVASVHIVMYGQNSSLNVNSALSIALHQICLKHW